MLLRKVYFDYFEKRLWRVLNSWHFQEIGVGSFFKKPLLLSKKYIFCGKNVLALYGGVRIQGVKRDGFSDPKITICDGVSFQQNTHLTCGNSIYIGENTAIAANVTITDIHHPYDDINLPIEWQPIEVSQVVIGPDCKIYNNAVILPGTNIGRHCTIGANSVVSGIYPDFCVIAGIPSRIVKQYNPELGKWIKVENIII